MSDRISLEEKYALFHEHWSPKVIAELNGQQVKLAKMLGEFPWHAHDDEDELFFVHRGAFRMEFRDRSVDLKAGDIIVVPKGVEHRPVAEHECEIMLFEPAATLHTGNVVTPLTKTVLDHI
jgi:mannose-6-phosphate isomerase-like protein (cupin superfamily)